MSDLPKRRTRSRIRPIHPNVVTVISDGSTVLVPCPRLSTQPSHGDFYNRYAVPAGSGIPDELVGGVFMLRLNETDRDQGAKYNRCRYLRTITILDENYKELYGQRNDTESGNARLKAALPNRRAHVKGPERLMVALLSYQLLKNSVAVATHRRRLSAEELNPLLAA